MMGVVMMGVVMMGVVMMGVAVTGIRSGLRTHRKSRAMTLRQ